MKTKTGSTNYTFSEKIVFCLPHKAKPWPKVHQAVLSISFKKILYVK